MKKFPVVLVDGSSYLFRAYHALPPLTNRQGEHTGAIYGVINMIRRLINDYQPRYVAVVFDTKEKTFRHDMYQDYKANRPEMPEELASQIKPLHEIIKALGLPLIMAPGYEADDVIGCLVKQAEKKGLNCLISTGDKDMAQLVNDHVTLINTMNNQLLDEQGVVDKFGVKPDQIIDYLTLIGDTSDNVPGVDKVGPKTAVKWLQQYHRLDDIISNADQIGGKVGENLRSALDYLPLSKKLVTIDCAMPLDIELTELNRQPQDQQALVEWFKRFEFTSWLKGLSDTVEKKAQHYQTILQEEALDQWIAKLEKNQRFAFDTETTSLNAMEAELVGVSISMQAGEAAYIPVAHDYLGAPEQLSKERVLAKLKPLLTTPNNEVIGQNLKYDYKVLARAGLRISAKMLDTMLQSYVLDSTSSRHDLDSLALKYLNHQTISYEEVAGKGRNQLRFDQVSIEKASDYAAEDADVAWQLADIFGESIAKDADLAKVLNEIELKLLPILAEMELRGVLINQEKLYSQSQEVGKKLRQLEEEVYNLAGEEFNIASTKQLSEIFYNKLQLPVLKKTPKGQPSTAEAVLQELALDYPLPKLIVDYRSLSKLKSTYLDSLPQQINAKTGRVHTSYRQAITSTGRLSSTDPNLQNIPIRTTEGRKIREAFIAPKGCRIISADYSQIELRIMAHLSGDESLIEAFNKDLDIHRATAAEVLSKPIDDVTDMERRSAKAINFGLIYGMSAFGLAKQLGVDRGSAQQYIDTYFARYPGVKRYMEETRELAHQQGFVQTCFGRKLFLPDIASKNGMIRKAAERAAINAPMQGTAADIIKLAMIKIDQWLRESALDMYMIMQVHDELIFEVAEKDVKLACQKIQECMESAFELSVPLKVAVGVGDNWEQAH